MPTPSSVCARCLTDPLYSSMSCSLSSDEVTDVQRDEEPREGLNVVTSSQSEGDLNKLDEHNLGTMGEVLVQRAQTVLMHCQPYPGDGTPINSTYRLGDQQFVVEQQDFHMYLIYDQVQDFEAHLHST